MATLTTYGLPVQVCSLPYTLLRRSLADPRFQPENTNLSREACSLRVVKRDLDRLCSFVCIPCLACCTVGAQPTSG